MSHSMTAKGWQLSLLLALLLLLFALPTTAQGQQVFNRGNTNGDTEVDISDAICILQYLFSTEGSSCGLQGCLDAVDTNDDGTPDVSDAVFLLSFLFQGGRPLPLPGATSCGPDPTGDALGCEASNCEPMVSPCTLIDVGGQGLQQDSDLAMDGEGNFFVAWEADSDEDDLFQIRGKAYNSDGTVRIDRFQLNFSSAFQQRDPTIAVDESGRFLAAWEDDNNNNGLFQIHARAFDAAGLERIPEFTVNVNAAGQQIDPEVAMDPSGNFVVVWAHDGNLDDNFEVEGRGFNADGTQLFAQIVVNGSQSKLQSNPAIAMDVGGNFTVVWQEKGTGNFNIMGRGFNADGTELFAPFTINDSQSGTQINPAIAMDAGGNFTVVWEHDGNLDDNFEIEGRGFNADGTELFAQFTINTSQSGQQVNPTVAMNAAGNFVVAWEHDGDSDGEFHVRFRGFNADGTENFVQTKADCIEPAQHLDPAIAIDGSGRFRVFWDETPNFLGPSHLLGRTFSQSEPVGQ